MTSKKKDCKDCAYGHLDNNGYARFYRCSYGKTGGFFPAATNVAVNPDKCPNWKSARAYLETNPGKATYKIEPWDYACNELQLGISTYDETGIRLCQIGYKDEYVQQMLEVYQRFENLTGDDRRGLLAALHYEPFIQQALAEYTDRFVCGDLCAGQLARLGHETRKECRARFGCVPDLDRMEFFSSFDNKTDDARISYLDATVPTWNSVHPLLLRALNQWVCGHIDGKTMYLEILMQHVMPVGMTR